MAFTHSANLLASPRSHLNMTANTAGRHMRLPTCAACAHIAAVATPDPEMWGRATSPGATCAKQRPLREQNAWPRPRNLRTQIGKQYGLGPATNFPALRKRRPIDGSSQGAKHLAAMPDCQLPHPNCSRECACKVGRCVPPERAPPDTTHPSVCREAHNNKTTESLSNVRNHSKTKLCATNVIFGRPHTETMSICHFVTALPRNPCREALVRVRPSA